MDRCGTFVVGILSAAQTPSYLTSAQLLRGFHVSDGFWPVVLIILFVIAWALAKIVANARKSEQQWREVDKSKLKKWQDDDEW